jgi:hypothetical protein
MAQQKKSGQIEEKIRQILEKLGEALADLLDKKRLNPQPIPLPVDRPYRRRKR